MKVCAVNLSVHKCGECVGCQLKARIYAHVKMIDELLVPRFAKAERAMSSATDQDIVDGYGAAGCVAPLITADPAPT